MGGLSEGEDLVNHVLGKFSKEEMDIMERSCTEAARAALCIIEEGVPEAMNRFNGMDLSGSEG